LTVLKEEIQKANLPIVLGAQTVSSFSSGAYTGEVSAQMLQGLVEYALIGHSERRRYFHENDETLSKKVMEAKKYGIKCIYGVEGIDQVIPVGTDMVLYEPPSAIGSGVVGNTEEVNTLCQKMSSLNNEIPFLYGGSVTEVTVKDFISKPSIFGVGVGGASLNPMQFAQLIDAMAAYE
jgi:triosephosphate isomerase